MKRSIEDIRSLISELKIVLLELYGKKLVKIILFGSFARNNASSDSDIDIAVILHGKVDKYHELDRLHDALYPLALKYGELVSFYPKNLKFSSHSGVVSQFGLHFVKTGIFKPQLGRDFNRYFDDRSSADYGFDSQVKLETTIKSFNRAQNFIKALKEYLRKNKLLL